MSIADEIANLISALNSSFNNIAEAAPIIGDVTTAVSKLKDAMLELNGSNTNYLRGLDKQIAYNEKLSERYIAAAKQTLTLERRNEQLNKSFGVGVREAAKLSESFQVVAESLKISGKQAGLYAGSIKKMVPTLNQMTEAGGDMYKSLAQTQHILRTNLGLTEDQTNAYTQYAEQNGKSSSSMLLATKQLAHTLDPEGTMGYFKMITSEIAATSEEITLQYGRLPMNLELAVLKAKKLGFTLEDLATSGDHLLEIESSIGEELEYQLLSGRRLVDNQGNSLTNMYREAALRGDMNKQADIMNSILETEGKTIENNMFARKQLALTLGIEEKQLASALQKKKILDKASAAGIDINLDGSNAMEQAADALKSNAITEAEFDELVDATNTRTTEDIMKQQLDTLQEANILSLLQLEQSTRVGENQDDILSNLSDSKFMLNAMSRFETLGDVRRQLAAKDAVVNAKTDFETATLGNELPTIDGNDAVITPGYGKRVLTFPEDTLQAPIAFNDNDTIVAGTNLAGKGGGSTGADISQFAAMIVAAINNQTRALKSDATFSGGLNAPYYG
jgi:hypothetical protein